ncbi:hypothetical protein [Curtobacterium sp. VKM Ac-1395]|uniref:hypothetical protein n=1 Tax=Curtobacterium sp. VKM Ac-1395 TaxID=2783815 RepID=UPI00188A7306|nr:hypothetical protein [Curtobacterium sp. VKM Ac-1395]MBF4588519.1 hypothetical protein [Curtobacterium sp. VKM Ac-1395]
MTNDDRSNDDRPRYGERITPDSTPQYGEQQQHGQQQGQQYGQQYGQQQQQGDQYGQQQGQQSDAPSWGGQQHQPQHHQQQYGSAPASSGGPAWQQHHESVAKKPTVGRIAFVASVIALVLGVIGGYVLGTALGATGVIRDLMQSGGTGSASDQQELQRQLQDSLMNSANGGQFAVGSVFMWVATLFGVWGIVQGIVAIATKRGRRWGVFAVILAVVAVIVAFVVYIGIAVSAS